MAIKNTSNSMDTSGYENNSRRYTDENGFIMIRAKPEDVVKTIDLSVSQEDRINEAIENFEKLLSNQPSNIPLKVFVLS